MKEIKNRLAEHVSVKERREKRKITHRIIAKESGVSKPTVGTYMNNDVLRVDLGVLQKFCTWLGIHPSEFFDWDDVEEEDTLDDDSVRMPVPA